MKRNVLNLFIIAVFLLLILWVVDFKVFIIFDLKIMLIMLLCILILTVASYKREESEFKVVFAYQVAITSIFATSLLFLQELSKASIIDLYTPLQPIFYGILYYLLGYIYHSLTSKQNGKRKASESVLQEKFNLSKRESVIAMEVLKDKSNKEIAAKLYIAESTVKKHVHNILKKTDCVNRNELKKLFDNQES